MQQHKQRATIHIFHLLVMIVTLRYSSISGGQQLNDMRGGEMQSAIHEDVFQFLHEFFCTQAREEDTVLVEGFASPWNYACSNYASAFASDLDFHFGSVGNFWDLDLLSINCKHVICEANPPVAPAFVNQMTMKIEEIFVASDSFSGTATSHPCVSVIVVVPTLLHEEKSSRCNAEKDNKEEQKQKRKAERNPLTKHVASKAFRNLLESKFCVTHIILPASDHGYVEGAQHLSQTRYKESAYDTSIILLQNNAARESISFDLTSFEDGIRRTFQSRHSEALV